MPKAAWQQGRSSIRTAKRTSKLPVNRIKERYSEVPPSAPVVRSLSSMLCCQLGCSKNGEPPEERFRPSFLFNGRQLQVRLDF